MSRPNHKARLVALLEEGPATTGEIVRHLGCGRSRAHMAVINLRRIGLAVGRKVPREQRRSGPRMTTEWSLAPPNIKAKPTREEGSA